MSSVAQLVLLIQGKDQTSEALKSANKGVSSFSDKLGTGLKVGAATGGAALIAMGVAGLGASNDLTKAQNELQVQLGLTGEEAKAMGDIAKAVYKDNFGGSMEDAAGVISQAFKVVGDVGDEELKRITENAFRLQDSFGVDTAESIDAVKTLMENFGLTSDQAFDLVVSGFQKGLNRSDDFLDTIGEYSTQFKNGGASAEQFFGLLESGLQGGMLGTDKAADAFKEFQVRILDGSTTTKKAMEQLGTAIGDTGVTDILEMIETGQMSVAEGFGIITDSLRQVKDPALQMQLGVALIGTQFEDLGASAATALTTTSEGFANVEGATVSLDAKYNTIGSRLEGLKRKAELALLPMAGHLQSALPMAGALGQAVGGLGPIVAGVGPAFALMSAQAVPALRAIGMALLTPPLGIIIAIAAAAVAIYIFRDDIIKAFKQIWEKVEPIVTAIRDGVLGGFNAVLDFGKDHWPEIATLISGPFAPIVLLATDAFGIRSAITGALDGILGKVWEWGSSLKSFFTSLPGTFKAAFGTGFDFLWIAFRDAINKIIDGWNGLSFSIPSVGKGPFKIDGFTLNTPNLPRLATGGPVMTGNPYIVGERGPELFVPSTSGQVVPNGQFGGAGATVNFYGPLTVAPIREAKDPRSALSDIAFAMAAELRSRGRMLTA